MAKTPQETKAEGSPTIGELEAILDDAPAAASVRETLESAMEEMGVGPDGEKIEKEAGSESDTEGEAAAAAEKAEDDKAAERAAAEKTASDADGEDDKGEAAAEGEGDKETPDADPEPPAEWTPDEHKAFHALPVDSQKFLLERVAAASTASEKAGSEAAKYSWLNDAIAMEVAPGVTREKYWAENGWSPTAAVNMILAVADKANADPAGFIKKLAADRGVNLLELAGVRTAGETDAEAEDPYADDPVVQALRAELGKSNARLEVLEGRAGAQDQTAEAREQQLIDDKIEEFALETTAAGKLAHPYFAQVKTLMGTMFSDGVATDLETAYSMACRAHPDVSTKIEHAKNAGRTRGEAEAARKKAAKASETGSSISGDTEGDAGPALTGDLREDLRARMAEANAFD